MMGRQRLHPAAAVGAQATCVLVLALLFRVMARTADDFFACILSQISQVRPGCFVPWGSSAGQRG